MGHLVTSGWVLCVSPDKGQALPLSPQRLVQATLTTRGSLVGTDGTAEPETSWGPRPVKPGGKAGQNVTPFHHLRSPWRKRRKMAGDREEEEGGCPSGPLPLPPCILRVITKCNLVWGAEGFLSTSA